MVENILFSVIAGAMSSKVVRDLVRECAEQLAKFLAVEKKFPKDAGRLLAPHNRLTSAPQRLMENEGCASPSRRSPGQPSLRPRSLLSVTPLTMW